MLTQLTKLTKNEASVHEIGFGILKTANYFGKSGIIYKTGLSCKIVIQGGFAMNIKKAFLSAIVLAMTLETAVCFAQIFKSDLSIGGIYYGQPLSEVVRMYGQPVWRKPNFIKFTSGSANIFITPSDTQDTVMGASITGGNPKLKTNAGIGSGSTLADVIAAYGEPDETSSVSVTYVTDLSDGNQYMLNFSIVSENKVFHLFFRKRKKNENYIEPKPRKMEPHDRSQSTIPAPVTEIPESELNIGGIVPGQNIDYVEQVYSKPGKIDDQGFFKIYNYNDKLVVKAKMNNGFKVMSVGIYEKGLATPSGFTVGMPYADVVKLFGRVNSVKFKGEGVEAKLKGCTDYTYYCKDKQIVFLVDKKDVVQGIRVEELDEQKFIEAKRKK